MILFLMKSIWVEETEQPLPIRLQVNFHSIT